MKALYPRIEDVTGMPGLTRDIADECFEWILDRLTQDDVAEALRDEFPDASEGQLLAIILAVSAAIQQP